MSNGNCVVGATHTADIKALQSRMDRHEEDQDKMWDTIDKLRNRLPLWATFAFGVLASCVTGLLVAMVR